ncbi:4Fe-4S binding protein [Rhodobacteraceae bacterium CH30]|nr:4Fe-4S binding protein [Rhodobacteraceae bacterium CH30]
MKDHIITRRRYSTVTSRGLNLTGLPLLGPVLRHPLFMTILQVASVSLLLLAIGLGLFSEDRKEGLTIVLFWGIFWPLLTCMTTPSLGPAFCAICPHGALGKWLQRFSLKRRFPKALRGAWVSFSLLFLGYWVLAFGAPSLLSTSTRFTAWYFLLFTLFAIGCFLFYANMAYCKHICPLGRVLVSHGKAGGLHIRTEQKDCSSCTTFECAKACHYHLSPFRFEERNNMENCTLCLDCVQSCDSAELHWMRPGKNLSQPVQRADQHDYWIIILVLAIAGVGIQFLHGLQHTGLRDSLPWNVAGQRLQHSLSLNTDIWNVSGLLALLFALLLTVPVAALGYRAAARLLGQPPRILAHDLAYALAPMAILGLIPHAVSTFAMKYGPMLVNETGTLLGYIWQAEAFAQRGDICLKVVNLLPWLGILWSLRLTWQRASQWSAGKVQLWAIWALACAPIWLYSAVLLTKLAAFILLPMPHLH